MADITGTVKVDDKAWWQGIEHLEVLIRENTADASMDAAALIEKYTKANLNLREHGPLAFSNAPGGSPPAKVSGTLSESIEHARDGATGAKVGPTGGHVEPVNHSDTSHYARIQELGGDMTGHPFMRFEKAGWGGQFRVIRDGTIIFSGASRTSRTIFLESFVRLAPRPYLRPATEEAVDSGQVRDIYARWWADAIEEGAG